MISGFLLYFPRCAFAKEENKIEIKREKRGDNEKNKMLIQVDGTLKIHSNYSL